MTKSIEMICWHDEQGSIRPYKFKMVDDEGEQLVIKVKRIIGKREESYAGAKCLIFNCISNINGYEKTFEIKYRKDSCKWFVTKII